MQYASAKPLIDQLFQAPGSFAAAYKAVVIAVTCAGGFLILLCLAMAAAVRRWDSYAGRLSLLLLYLWAASEMYHTVPPFRH